MSDARSSTGQGVRVFCTLFPAITEQRKWVRPGTDDIQIYIMRRRKFDKNLSHGTFFPPYCLSIPRILVTVKAWKIVGFFFV